LKTLIRQVLSFLLLLSAAPAAEDILVEPQEDGVIVRSPVAAANFLFRTPKGFARADPGEGFQVGLEASDGPAKATIRLRYGDLTPTEARSGLDGFLKNHEEEYRRGLDGQLGVTGGRGRRIAMIEGKEALRIVVVVFDGTRRYELLLDATPRDSALAEQLAAVAEGFTILDPKGAPEGPALAGSEKAAPLAHDYYRLKLLKPAGFLQQEVDPDQDKGIYLHLRREDEQKNRCDIRVRVFLAKAVKQGAEELAKERIDAFRNKHESPKGPERPKRSGTMDSFRWKQAGRLTGGLVVEEERWVLEHENGRMYEFEVVCFGGASRAFKKDIDAFWKSIKFDDK
jgi:hypothetical protein